MQRLLITSLLILVPVLAFAAAGSAALESGTHALLVTGLIGLVLMRLRRE